MAPDCQKDRLLGRTGMQERNQEYLRCRMTLAARVCGVGTGTVQDNFPRTSVRERNRNYSDFLRSMISAARVCERETNTAPISDAGRSRPYEYAGEKSEPRRSRMILTSSKFNEGHQHRSKAFKAKGGCMSKYSRSSPELDDDTVDLRKPSVQLQDTRESTSICLPR